MGKIEIRNRTRLKTDSGLLLFRIGAALVMLFYHGIPKFRLLISGDKIQFADPIGIGIMASFILATFAEFLCSLLVLTGLWTRWAALVLAVTMFVAAFMHLDAVSFSESSKQLAYLFMLCFILLSLSGAGRFSLDNLLFRKK